jgi:hypothetical protein
MGWVRTSGDGFPKFTERALSRLVKQRRGRPTVKKNKRDYEGKITIEDEKIFAK